MSRFMIVLAAVSFLAPVALAGDSTAAGVGGDYNPSEAAREFAAGHPEFVLEQPEWPFNESELGKNVTHWPDAWLRRT